MASPRLGGSPTLVEQATAILQAATRLQQQLNDQSLPQPTFEVQGGRKDWHDASQHPDILRTRSALIDASRAMLDLTLGPMDGLAALAGPDVNKNEVLRTLDTLGVAAAVPLEGDIAIAQLAQELGVNERLLDRQLRFAFLMGVFRESRCGFVAHTASSAALPDIAPWLRLRSSLLLTNGASKVPEALAARSEDEMQVKIPIQLADPKNRDMWTILGEDYPSGEGMRFFSAGMESMMVGLLGESLTPYVHGFDWASLGAGTVIDVGGGNGHVEVVLLPKIPSVVKFVIQDLPTNEAPAHALISKHEAHDRITFRAHDFFLPQPAADPPPQAYLLSRVLHDWRDDECVKILQRLLPAMERHGTKLWLCERVLPARGDQVLGHIEQQMRAQDLLMFTLFGGGERTLADWESVFARTDRRLRVNVLRQPLDSVFSFIEVVLDA